MEREREMGRESKMPGSPFQITKNIPFFNSNCLLDFFGLFLNSDCLHPPMFYQIQYLKMLHVLLPHKSWPEG